ncbi:LysR family transcriptional regulator [Dyadobacter tibetensis]|uniref:LysR family transcriptional regulator n=1 Tax=Dyadobacter tibetensis TaxID=1211851 RepID=UPI000470B5CA|nr:LysR family transcriptional regulator [Dyadobacter tibetensis]
MVNLEWFRTFRAVYEKGSLTAAAESLYISQPGVSLHLSSLEAHVGYKLFDRSSKKMLATERGKLLYNFVMEPLIKLEQAEQHFQKSKEKERPTISIGMCFETFQFTLEPYLSELPFNVIIKFGEYPEMLKDLDHGILDLIITPQKGDFRSLLFKPFYKERIVLISGSETDTSTFQDLLVANRQEELHQWLVQQIWYGTTADMEHLRRFWQQNFGKRPDFRPNFIVPNISSIIRCMGGGRGLAVSPDFLTQKELHSGRIKVLWEGYQPIENTLYFGMRKKSIYTKQIELVESIFLKEMVGE